MMEIDKNNARLIYAERGFEFIARYQIDGMPSHESAFSVAVLFRGRLAHRAASFLPAGAGAHLDGLRSRLHQKNLNDVVEVSVPSPEWIAIYCFQYARDYIAPPARVAVQRLDPPAGAIYDGRW